MKKLPIFRVALGFVLVAIYSVQAYQIPTPRINLLQPAGFKVSIPDDAGIKVFAFHGKKNSAFVGTESGNIRGQVAREEDESGTGERWVFTNSNVELQSGDRLNYWLYVQHNSLAYRLYGQTYTVPADLVQLITTENPTTTTPSAIPTAIPNCVQSITTILGKTYCKGMRLFDDNFDRPSLMPIWQHEVRIPLDTQDAEFVSYQSDASLCSVVEGKLRIRPKLLINEPGFSRITSNTSINLGMPCTPIRSRDLECEREAWAYRILPPIVSCKLNTKGSFRFTYGRIEIRAKLPKGDWLFPEIFLEPFFEEYGAGYDSGQMRVAYIRSNDELYTSELENIDGHTLSGGVVLSTQAEQRDWFLKKKVDTEHFGDAFHVYTLIWTDTEIALQVDNVPYGRIVGDDLRLKGPLNAPWRSGSNMAPFDKEFYISLGIGAGGMGDFPDNSKTGRGRRQKPWVNDHPKAEFNFWQDYDNWKQTWTSDNVQMEIDYVRVYAI